MPVPSANLPAWIVVEEVYCQCLIAIRAFDQLSHGVTGWRKTQKFDPHGMAPNDMLIRCNTLLSSFAVMNQMLFSHSGNQADGRKRIRQENLRQLLGVPDLPMIRSVKVRNSFEHIDERLDDLLAQGFPPRFESLRINDDPATADTTVLRWIQPSRLVLSFDDHQLDLRACIQEVQTLKQAAMDARVILTQRIVSLWDRA